jgi:hypothetical protein
MSETQWTMDNGQLTTMNRVPMSVVNYQLLIDDYPSGRGML